MYFSIGSNFIPLLLKKVVTPKIIKNSKNNQKNSRKRLKKDKRGEKRKKLLLNLNNNNNNNSKMPCSMLLFLKELCKIFLTRMEFAWILRKNRIYPWVGN
jgi:hypothetical protein